MFDSERPSSKLQVSITAVIKRLQTNNNNTHLQNISRQFLQNYVHLNQQIKVLFAPDSFMFKQVTEGATNDSKVAFTDSKARLNQPAFDCKAVQSILLDVYGATLADPQPITDAIRQDHIVALKVDPQVFTLFAKEAHALSPSLDDLPHHLHRLKHICHSLFQSQIETIFKDFCKIYFEIFSSYNKDLQRRIKNNPGFSKDNLRPETMELKETAFVREMANNTISKIIRQSGLDEEEYWNQKKESAGSEGSLFEEALRPMQEEFSRESPGASSQASPKHSRQHSLPQEEQAPANKQCQLKQVINRKIQKYRRINDTLPMDYDHPSGFLQRQLGHFNHDQLMVHEVAKYKTMGTPMKHSDVNQLNQRLHFQKQQIINKTESSQNRAKDSLSSSKKVMPPRNKSVSLNATEFAKVRRNQSTCTPSFPPKRLTLEKHSLFSISERKAASTSHSGQPVLRASTSQKGRAQSIMNRKIQHVKEINANIQKTMESRKE